MSVKPPLKRKPLTANVPSPVALDVTEETHRQGERARPRHPLKIEQISARRRAKKPLLPQRTPYFPFLSPRRRTDTQRRRHIVPRGSVLLFLPPNVNSKSLSLSLSLSLPLPLSGSLSLSLGEALSRARGIFQVGPLCRLRRRHCGPLKEGKER